MPKYKYILGVGFLFSAITSGALGTLVGAFIALYTYVIGIVLRGFGWIALGRSFRGPYILTGILVLILGIGVLIAYSMELVIAMISMWSIYSILEFYSYNTLRKISKIFAAAMISIIGIIIVDLNLVNAKSIQTLEGITQTIVIGFWILALSALIASVGFFTFKPIEHY